MAQDVIFYTIDSTIKVASVQAAETETAQRYEHRGGENGQYQCASIMCNAHAHTAFC